MEEEPAPKALYEAMITAHKDQFGEVSVRMRHYLRGLAGELTTRMGFTRELYAQAEDSPDTVTSAPVEAKWDQERRDRGAQRSPDGKPWPVRRWREVQIIQSASLPQRRSGGEDRVHAHRVVRFYRIAAARASVALHDQWEVIARIYTL